MSSSTTTGADVPKSASTSSKPTSSTRKLRHSNPPLPTPFTPAPDNVKPLLSTLDKRHVYITHIDIHPGWFKKRVFLVPVSLNLAIALLLGWRLWVVGPWYTQILSTMFDWSGESASMWKVEGDWKTKTWALLWRVLTFVMDYLLVTIVAPWPYSFFLERPGNPMRWRSLIRFREQEVCVRISRGWGAGELVGGVKKGDQSPYWKTRIAPAITRENWMKTAYMLMGKDWDLDFAAMVKAHQVVDEKDKFDTDLKLKDLDRKVWVWYPPPSPEVVRGDAVDNGQWVVAGVGDVSFEAQAIDASGLDFEGTEEGKRKILQMRNKLAEMGKEDLFVKWVQLVQEEVGKPGGFTRERQLETGLKVQALFEEEGVDWEKFANEVGMEQGNST